jgi:hypothetical protein
MNASTQTVLDTVKLKWIGHGSPWTTGTVGYYAKLGKAKALKVLFVAGLPARLPRPGYEIVVEPHALWLENKGGRYELRAAAELGAHLVEPSGGGKRRAAGKGRLLGDRCADCGHQRATHDGRCFVGGCSCAGFKTGGAHGLASAVTALRHAMKG